LQGGAEAGSQQRVISLNNNDNLILITEVLLNSRYST